MMKPVRCAIYTRKSSEEGLEQDFNSLDAQREGCAAYILSQASEGWSCVSERYDDGGISGGTLERPALRQLMADIEAGSIDIIVVYKVDRLTRSLLDFARLVEAFDRKGVSFVSITQSFNTTTSMGRLTLNMLLSFAQFEREVTAERIRDKLAASKAKGMWMGGIPPLGYRPDGRSLAIIEEHAALIRHIYARYLKLGTVRELAEELVREGITSPRRSTATGLGYGGGYLLRGQLYAILKNPIYTGHIVHKDRCYPGLHAAIIEQALFDQVQARLKAQTQGAERVRRQSRAPTASLLAGLLFDEAGAPLIASHSAKPAPRGADTARQRYRYYVSKALIDGSARQVASANITPWRIPAREIEQLVLSELAQLFADPLTLAARAGLALDPAALPRVMAMAEQMRGACLDRTPQALRRLITRVELMPTGISLMLSSSALGTLFDLPLIEGAAADVHHPCAVRLTRTGLAVKLVTANGAIANGSAADPTLLKLILRARSWWRSISEEDLTLSTLAAREGVTVSWAQRVLRLAFLSPSIIEAMLEGRLRAGIDAKALLLDATLPACWKHQEQLLLPG